MNLTVGDLAAKLGGAVEGDGGALVTGVAGLKEAGPADVSFLANPRYAPQLAGTRAAAVIVPRDWTGGGPCPLIRVDSADKAFMQTAILMRPPIPPPPPGVHHTAILASGVTLGKDVSIGPYCVLDAGVRIGDRSVLMAACCLGQGTVIGNDCRLYPHVTTREGTLMGNRCILHNGAVIGSDGFGYFPENGAWRKIPQVGIVEIGDDVEIGANTTIDRARFGKTVIANGVKIDNLVQIAHNVRIDEHSAIAGQAGFAGSATIGRRVQIGGQAGIAGHISVGDDCVVSAQAGVTKDVPAGTFAFGFPAMPADKAKRLHAHMMRLPALKDKIAGLEQRIAALEKSLPKGEA